MVFLMVNEKLSVKLDCVKLFILQPFRRTCKQHANHV